MRLWDTGLVPVMHSLGFVNLEIMMKKLLCSIFVLSILFACQDEQPLRQRIGDTAPSERWIYDDWQKAKAESSDTGKPLFVVFRCVP